MLVRLLTIGLLALLAAGCSARNCGGNAAYLAVSPSTEFVQPAGIDLPPASGAYDIPPGGEAEYELSGEYLDAAGRKRQTCLFEPPRLPVTPAAEPAAEG